MIKFNLKMGNAPVSITLNSTNYKPEEVLEIIKNYKSSYSLIDIYKGANFVSSFKVYGKVNSFKSNSGQSQFLSRCQFF